MGYRMYLIANYLPMAVPLKLDITTGDKITPKVLKQAITATSQKRGS